MLFVNVVKPTHLCNLDCKYCYNDDLRQPIMTQDTLPRTIGQTFESARTIPSIHQGDFIWHGGEPTVVGLPFYEQA